MACLENILTRTLLAASLIIGGSFTLARAADPGVVVKTAYEKYKDLDEGANADYIPALAKGDPKLFGIVLITVDGDHRFWRATRNTQNDGVSYVRMFGKGGDRYS